MIASSRCLGIVKEYEEVLAGVKKSLPTIYFSKKSNQTVATDFLAYVFEGILKWGKEDVRDRLDSSIINRLKLERAINSLDFPPELDPKSDLWYVSCLLYPDSFRYDKDRHTIATYEKVLSGRLPRFPKWFFTDFEGEVNSALCLNHAISRFLPFKTIPGLYELFSSPKAAGFLNEVKLLDPCLHYYDSPLDMLHNSLCEEEKDDYYYRLYKLQAVLQKSGLPNVLATASSFAGKKSEYVEMKHAFEESFNDLYDKTEDVNDADQD